VIPKPCPLVIKDLFNLHGIHQALCGNKLFNGSSSTAYGDSLDMAGPPHVPLKLVNRIEACQTLGVYRQIRWLTRYSNCYKKMLY